jgi:hypothetical protein
MKNMIKNALLVTILLVNIFSCKKKEVDPTPPTIVPERLEITPTSSSILVGETKQFTLKFFNNIGVQATVPTNIVWSSNNNSITTVSQQGLATGVNAGQTEIKATYNNISITGLLTVANNNTQLATITLTPNDVQEVKLNETVTITAVGKNNAGGILSGLTFTWLSAATNTVEVTSGGVVTGKAYGTANITAASSGITSAPVMVQVIRKGTFSGSNSAGMVKLKIENGILKLQTTPDFSVNNGAPDLRIYLTNTANPTSLTGALEVADLANPSQYTGSHTWNVPMPTTITTYRYVFVWCAQFGGTYGIADLGS